MKRTRRIGSVTLGITLILTGIVYLVKMIAPAFDLITVIRFWPVIFITLGVEILVENGLSIKTEVQYIYDIFSMLMIIATGAFAVGMAGTEIIMSHIY